MRAKLLFRLTWKKPVLASLTCLRKQGRNPACGRRAGRPGSVSHLTSFHLRKIGTGEMGLVLNIGGEPICSQMANHFAPGKSPFRNVRRSIQSVLFSQVYSTNLTHY